MEDGTKNFDVYAMRGKESSKKFISGNSIKSSIKKSILNANAYLKTDSSFYIDGCIAYIARVYSGVDNKYKVLFSIDGFNTNIFRRFFNSGKQPDILLKYVYDSSDERIINAILKAQESCSPNVDYITTYIRNYIKAESFIKRFIGDLSSEEKSFVANLEAYKINAFLDDTVLNLLSKNRKAMISLCINRYGLKRFVSLYNIELNKNVISKIRCDEKTKFDSVIEKYHVCNSNCVPKIAHDSIMSMDDEEIFNLSNGEYLRHILFMMSNSSVGNYLDVFKNSESNSIEYEYIDSCCDCIEIRFKDFSKYGYGVKHTVKIPKYDVIKYYRPEHYKQINC